MNIYRSETGKYSSFHMIWTQNHRKPKKSTFSSISWLFNQLSSELCSFFNNNPSGVVITHTFLSFPSLSLPPHPHSLNPPHLPLSFHHSLTSISPSWPVHYWCNILVSGMLLHNDSSDSVTVQGGVILHALMILNETLQQWPVSWGRFLTSRAHNHSSDVKRIIFAKSENKENTIFMHMKCLNLPYEILID